MRTLTRIAALIIFATAIGCSAVSTCAQTAPPAPPEVPVQPMPGTWRDLVNHLQGGWSVTGDVMGKTAHHTVSGNWVLDNQFLRITERTANSAPAGERRYESIWFLGYDDVNERYVMHLMDTFGGRFSETLGYGIRDGNTLHFIFEYPDGPFHTDFTWDPQAQTWTWLMQQKNTSGQWTQFAKLTLTKSK